MNLEGKDVHPFFSKSSTTHVPDPLRTPNETSTDDAPHDPEYVDTSPKSAKGRKKRTRKTENVQDKKTGPNGKSQASLHMFTRRARTEGASESAMGNSNTPLEPSLEVDPNHGRRKRQKTTSPGPLSDSPTSAEPQFDALEWYRQLQAEAEKLTMTPESMEPSLETDVAMADIVQDQVHTQERQSVPPTASNALPPLADQEVAVTQSEPIASETKTATPKKQIKVTKSGKLVSSPPKPVLDPATPPKKRRARKSAKPKISPTVTVIKYGADATSRSAIGERIDDILNDMKTTTARPATPEKPPSRPTGPHKITHPFFLRKAQKESSSSNVVAEQPLPNPRKSAVTPGKLRAEAHRERSPAPMPAFGSMSGSRKVGKLSGLTEAPWPTGFNAHVRGFGIPHPPRRVHDSTNTGLALKPKKLKNAVGTMPQKEDLVARLALDFSKSITTKKYQPASDFEPPQDVRLPTRLLTTGAEIQRRINERLLAQLPSSATQGERQQAVHPAVADLYNNIAQTLTPFDEGRCETQSWAQKYSPTCASHVLQTGQNAMVLKDWLQSLTVLAVGGTLKVGNSLNAKRPPQKKRKKDLDGFIVSDDEEDEDEEMIAIPGPEGTSTKLTSCRRPQWTRNMNVVLISGPHGCGKSATVHAVAKEQGFEVFEIHAGMRRSGKDVQDKVGDMTANHLVNHKRGVASVHETAPPADDTDDDRMDLALEKDLTMGRQGTMTSFFQIKPTVNSAKPKIKANLPDIKKVAASAAQATLPLAQASRPSQKQSLILIEEADLLFEEDQQFWAQVTKIASLSKRPIVITCNDERQIPMQDLPLAAILRLQPAPVDLATDYMLVLAGREGHILERQAVRDLYKATHHDLRASIMELDMWCQMSVGDKKGGLEWMYQRWPPGTDVDEHGRTLRVASEGTYASGMGWLSHNVFQTQANAVFDREEELLHQVWATWGISPSAWCTAATNNEEKPGFESLEPSGRVAALERLEDYADSLSAADVFCRVGLPSYDNNRGQPTDSSQPPLTDKVRLSYTLAAPLLQVDHRTDYLNLDTYFSTQTHLLLQRTYPDLFHHLTPTIPKPETESEYTKAILGHLHQRRTTTSLTRADFATAFDILAATPDQSLVERTSFALTPSSFDRTFNIITLDLAPYVRNIVAHEQVLEAQRIRMSTLLSAGGTGKRARTTRASRAALEGGVRETKRRERWFDASLDFGAVMQTAGQWAGLGWKGEEEGTQDGDGDVNMVAAHE
ncbi:hypothetical protein BDW02DRAFT_554297 [Decorospora gaudefroyi]|uniref:AAA+ ATPase domain-containing protein n=1 Tax=Decorospora gaudefroyi TaxID=184978 RepID=A0A6A5K7F1_9PLEO|nr:hypothetical protein BDW02DRAFT_554297 [Decorospora gaudefroyi]